MNKRRTFHWVFPVALATGLLSACLDASAPIVWLDESPLSSATVAADGTGSAERTASVQGALRNIPEAASRQFDALPLPTNPLQPAPARLLGEGVEPLDSLRCDGSVVARLSIRGEVAVWWSERAGARVHLVAAWRDSGQLLWRGPIVVDSLDVGSTDARDAAEGGAIGCARPAAGLAVDGANGYVHVSYALVGPEGPGIFYAHQMDPRASFEPPIAIVYGERLGTARVASDGNLVAVAYEDPNSGSRQRIALAVSRTAGHLFERRMNVNTGLNPAANPFVAAQGAAVAVGWDEVPPSGGTTSFLQRRGAVR